MTTIAVLKRGEVEVCPMPYALCQIVPHVTEKGYILVLNLNQKPRPDVDQAAVFLS
jgi:hypothetical protein